MQLDCWPVWERVLTATDVAEVGKTIPIPILTAKDLLWLCHRAKEVLKQQQSVMHIYTQCYVIGDLHGNFHDLIRIFQQTHIRPPADTTFLFLGDYVDRGSFSIEVVSLLFSFLVEFPEQVVLLRGNHEFRSINAVYGFGAEVEAVYRESAPEVYEAINSVFDWLPVAAVVQNSIFCCHGGISPRITSVSSLMDLTRPISQCTGQVSDLTWSDPAKGCTSTENARGQGYIFGSKMTSTFLSENKLTMIIRSHQWVNRGVKTYQGRQVYTVFSSSNYGRDRRGRGNSGAILKITDQQQLVVSLYDPPTVCWPLRSVCKFWTARNCSRTTDVLAFKKPINQGLNRWNVRNMFISPKRKTVIAIPMQASSGALRRTFESTPPPMLQPETVPSMDRLDEVATDTEESDERLPAARSLPMHRRCSLPTALEDPSSFGDFCFLVNRRNSE